MVRIALAALLVVSTACGTRPSEEALPAGQLAPDDLSEDERTAFVYAAAIRHLVEDVPGAPRTILVLDRAQGPDGTSVPIPRGVQDRVREELALLGSVRFVDEAAANDRGTVVITLNAVPPDGDRLELPTKVEGPRAEKRRTLVLERVDLRWKVTEARGDGGA